MDLNGRNLLITGANRGVGASFVTAALDGGAGTVYAGVRTLDSMTGAHPDRTGQLVPVQLDVTDVDQVNAAAATASDVDLLVINAGVTCIMPILATPDETAFRETMEVNFFGSLHLVRAFADTLKSRGGGILMVLSVAGVTLSRSAPLYSASKAAAVMLGLGVREELREEGVSVTISLPGFIKTDMSEGMKYPRASPDSVAMRSLQGWLDGAPTVWPDRFSELVSERIGPSMQQILDTPRAVMNEVTGAFLEDPRAGQ